MKKTNKERIEELEEQVKTLNDLIRFHKLDKIPIKYRKAFPKKNECPFFEVGPFDPTTPYVQNLSFGDGYNPTKIAIPSKEVLNESKERMMKYAEEKNMITQLYYELLEDEIREDGLSYAIKKGETLCIEEAKKWEEEAKSYEYVHKMDDGREYKSIINPRSYKSCYRKIKPQISEESQAASLKQDVDQQNQTSSSQ